MASSEEIVRQTRRTATLVAVLPNKLVDWDTYQPPPALCTSNKVNSSEDSEMIKNKLANIGKPYLIRTFAIITLLCWSLLTETVNAMICTDQRYNQSFQINEFNGHSFQIENPMNQGISYRDPTGQFYMRLPAANPYMEAYFAAWDGRLILLNSLGPSVIGVCQQINSMPLQPIFKVPNLPPSPYQVVGAPQGSVSIPSSFAPQKPGYVKPAYASEQAMNQCLNSSGGNRGEFINCAAKKMFSPQQVAIYDCVANSPDDNMRAQCLAGQLLGQNERRVLNQVQDCYQQSGGDWQQMPLCLADQQFDQNTQRTIGCIQSQMQSGSVSAWGTVACVGSNNLNMNPEMTIAVQCATTTGGDPLAWAGCTGGQLTERELSKCLTNGVGGEDGCFGPNNTIVQGLNQLGQAMQQQFGSNNAVVIGFNNAVNDITHGPGPSNDLVKIINNVSNDLAHGPGESNDIRKFANDVFPGIW